MSTPVSSALPYCSAAQLFGFAAPRTVGDLAGDAGKRVPYCVIAAGSDGAVLPQATISVVSPPGTGDFPASGTTPIATSLGVQTITYTGVTGSTFTGCTGGTGTLALGGIVSPMLTLATVAAALGWGAGEIESACFAGARYSPADLNSLTGVSLQNLQGLNAGLALYKLFRFRDPNKAMSDEEALHFQKLQQLRLGERIFGLQEVADAGVGMEVTNQSNSMIDQLGLTTMQARPYYGQRTNRLRNLARGGE